MDTTVDFPKARATLFERDSKLYLDLSALEPAGEIAAAATVRRWWCDAARALGVQNSTGRPLSCSTFGCCAGVERAVGDPVPVLRVSIGDPVKHREWWKVCTAGGGLDVSIVVFFEYPDDAEYPSVEAAEAQARIEAAAHGLTLRALCLVGHPAYGPERPYPYNDIITVVLEAARSDGIEVH